MSRFGSVNQRKALKEKVVQQYELIFRSSNSDDGEGKFTNPIFWEEFFLLKCNISALEGEIRKLTSEQFQQLAETKGPPHPAHHLFSNSLIAIQSDNPMRQINALATMLVLSKEFLSKARENNLDPVALLISRNEMDRKFMELLDKFNEMLIADIPIGFKGLILNILLAFTTGCDPLDDNPFLAHLMSEQLFDSLLELLSDPASRVVCGYKIIVLLVALANYRKNTESNLYTLRLSIEDSEVALSAFAQVISCSLAEFNRKYQLKHQSSKTGLLSSFTNMVGNMFVPDENMVERRNTRVKNAVLLAFYEGIHLNRNFISLLTNTQSDLYDDQPVSLSLSNHSDSSGGGGMMAEKQSLASDISMPNELPTNLLSAFVEFCSIVMLPMRDESNMNTVRLCLIILQCITEDNCANSIIHDANLVYRVQLHRVPMRHRKLNEEQQNKPKQLAFHILDLMVEFIMTHMRKNLPTDLYLLTIGIIHRVICYQKKCRLDTPTDFNWKELWNALISLLKFIATHETDLTRQASTFLLINQIINIFNLFITFGDTFLHSHTVYDDLYYEIIRMHSVFENLYSMMLRYSANEGNEFKSSATKIAGNLVNIRAIIGHYSPKIESATHQMHSSLTGEQVLDIVRHNYDTLKLKLQDNLDQYETHKSSESTPLFLLMLQDTISDYRAGSSSSISPKELNALITDLQARNKSADQLGK